MSEVIIRKYKEDDLNDVFDMIQLSFKTAILDKVYEEEVKEFWKNEYTFEEIEKLSKVGHFYVAELDGKIVGSGCVKEDDNKAYICGVFIDPNIQGVGLGTRIMDVLEKDKICIKTKIACLTAALSASRFYQKLGYSFKYDVPEIVSEGCLDIVYMEKDL